MGGEESSRPAVLRDAKALQIHGDKTLRRDLSAGNAWQGNPHHCGARLIGTLKDIRRDVQAIRADREIRKIKKCSRNPEARGRDVIQPPTSLSHVSR